jgi:hypothetical protein
MRRGSAPDPEVYRGIKAQKTSSHDESRCPGYGSAGSVEITGLSLYRRQI